MQEARSVLTQEVPEHLRIAALTGIVNRPLVRRAWVNGNRGCLMAVAVSQITGMSLHQFEIQGDYTRLSAKTLQIPQDRVEACYRDWDNMGRRQARRFIRTLKADLAVLVAQQKMRQGQPPQNFAQRAVSKVRELVTA